MFVKLKKENEIKILKKVLSIRAIENDKLEIVYLKIGTMGNLERETELISLVDPHKYIKMVVEIE